jgi:hypothetical protein
MTLKVGGNHSQAWSMFAVGNVGPGLDVAAHLHRSAEELLYVLDGQPSAQPSVINQGPPVRSPRHTRARPPRWGRR